MLTSLGARRREECVAELDGIDVEWRNALALFFPDPLIHRRAVQVDVDDGCRESPAAGGGWRVPIHPSIHLFPPIAASNATHTVQ